MKKVFALCLFALSLGLVGCGSSEPTNILDNSDQAAQAEYDRLIAEQDSAAEQDSGDADEGP